MIWCFAVFWSTATVLLSGGPVFQLYENQSFPTLVDDIQLGLCSGGHDSVETSTAVAVVLPVEHACPVPSDFSGSSSHLDVEIKNYCMPKYGYFTKDKGDPEMILVTQWTFYAFCIFVSLLIFALLACNCATCTKGLEIKRISKQDVAAYEALQEKFSELYEHMTAETEIEGKALKRTKQKFKMAKADKNFKFQKSCHYKRIILSDTSAKNALEADNRKLKNLVVSLEAQVKSVKAENGAVEEQLSKQSEDYHTMAVMEKTEENARAIRDELKMSLKEAKEVVERLKLSRNEKEEKIKVAKEKLAAAKGQLVQVLWDMNVKGQETRQIVEQTQHKINGYKMRISDLKQACHFKKSAANVSIKYIGPKQVFFSPFQQQLLQFNGDCWSRDDSPNHEMILLVARFQSLVA